MKHLTIVLSALVLTVFVATGCKKKQETETEITPVAAKTTEEAQPAAQEQPQEVIQEAEVKTEEAAPAKTEEAAGGEIAKVGVPECDDYIAKMTTCLEKMPAAVRDGQKKGLANMASSWSKVEGPAKEQLGETCKAAKDAAAKALSAQGCEF